MSKYIQEIVKDIRENPLTWKRTYDNELSKGDIKIRSLGNGSKWFFYWGTSTVDVKVSGISSKMSNLTAFDKASLEEAFIWWIQNISLNHLNK